MLLHTQVHSSLAYTIIPIQQLYRKQSLYHCSIFYVDVTMQKGQHRKTDRKIKYFNCTLLRCHSLFLSFPLRVAVTRSKDIPLFGPLFPKGARFPRSPAFRDFLLAKAVNAENAAEKSEKFRSMATRTRQEYLKDLAENYVTTTPIDSSTKFPLLSLGGKRKDKLKGAKGAELHSAGALVWAVMVNSGLDTEVGEHKLPCLLGVSAESVVLIERYTRRVVFNCSCRDVIGWKAVTETKEGGPCLDIFYERGESVSISVMENQAEDIKEVVQRLEVGEFDLQPLSHC